MPSMGVPIGDVKDHALRPAEWSHRIVISRLVARRTTRCSNSSLSKCLQIVHAIGLVAATQGDRFWQIRLFLGFYCSMQFSNVALVAIESAIPDEIWTSAEIERRLEPLYRRLKLPEGRLELMSGVAQRRVWSVGTPPSTPSITTARRAIESSGVDPETIGALIHASVCRDFLEPATATRVHGELGLPESGWVYDVSNACLGIVNGAVQIATLIQSGVISAGVVVGTENARMLLDQTIDHLNRDESLTRKTVKPAFASLTIGSASAAWVLVHTDLLDRLPAGRSTPAMRITAASALARTRFNHLCRSDTDAGASMAPLMDTDSEQLLIEGIATARDNFESLLNVSGWDRSQIDRTVSHQVGSRHRAAMLQTLGLNAHQDSITFDRLGNTGSAALPVTLHHAIERGEIQPGHRVAMLGIGSGINSVMLTAEVMT